MADRYVEVRGARIRYRREGTGPAVVLIHGLGASLESWDLTAPALADRHTVVRFDFPGFGLSDSLPGAYTPEGAVEAVLAILAALDVAGAALVGTSLGGGIATLTAGRAPDLFTSLVLAAPAGFARPVGRGVWWLALPAVGEVLLAYLRWHPRRSMEGAYADPALVPGWLVEVARRNLARPQVRRTILRVLRETLGRGGVRPELVGAIRDAAARIGVPTLVIWGTADRVIPCAQAQAVAAAIPTARLRLLPGLGHVPYLEDAEAFTAALTGFLSEVAARPAGVAR
ncbi:MAG: alpha/beta fold hydrolase [Armatimonadota bacterium]|nr:alpha/beta fold hydrolase [Armatimonadota bacterium]MDR7421055.1 alpha/beta fold hydrolase [Armatimonadota bacterium]MDR7455627.1 alpha/beta fold hydrolase [Armatimonadota bacterium]MDR7456846.1 alpha/beta fold hydrolase [Armatimonadota bacterium]MDR7495513.1 alpha/beta fold hydrolase [Armatimonadota bacterium]